MTKVGDFQSIADSIQPRLVVSATALNKCGKTHLGLTAPKPIGYMGFDIGGLEGVVEKFGLSKNDIQHVDLRKASNPDIGKLWDKFIRNFLLSIKNFRTTVIDTSSECWETARMARLGKLEQVPPHKYVAVNREFRDLLNEIYSSDNNLVLLHKAKKQYVTKIVKTPQGEKEIGGWNGKYERAGFAETGFIVQVNVVCQRNEITDANGLSKGFGVLVEDCRQNPDLRGVLLEGGIGEGMLMTSFQGLGTSVYPESSWEEWL